MRATRRTSSAASPPACAAARRSSTARAATGPAMPTPSACSTPRPTRSPRSKPAARRSTGCRSRPAARPGIIPAARARSSSARRRCSGISASSIRRRWRRSTCPARSAGFEVFVDAMPEPKAKPTRTKPRLDLSPFQAVKRDFAFVVDKAVEAGTLTRAALAADRKLITGVSVFDVFEGAVARRGQEVDRHRGVDPAGREDADRRGFRGARRPHRRERQEADRRRAAELGGDAPRLPVGLRHRRRRCSACRRSGPARPARRSRRARRRSARCSPLRHWLRDWRSCASRGSAR